jgi:general secretion pathway protein D
VRKDFRLGVEWQAADEVATKDGNPIVGFGRSTSDGSVSNLQSDLGGLLLGVFGQGLEISGIQFPSIQAVVNALQSESDVYILQNPQIMTTDNEEAQIVVAKNVPFQTRVDTTGDVTGREFSTFEYRDVGVTLNITPQINQERFVRLKIEQTVEQVVEEESVQGLPTTLKRTAKTTVIVKDGNSVVIGGLIGEPMSESLSMTPCLGNITGLGWLFKSVRRQSEKTNLYFFLTPHIVENPNEATEIYLDKQDELEKAKKFSNEGVIKMYERAGIKESDDDVQLANLGYQHLQAKQYQKAKEYFEKALKINPDNPYALLNMGVIYEVEGNRDQAIKMYEKVISLNPDAKAASSTDPENKGKPLTDIARDNMERLQKEGK